MFIPPIQKDLVQAEAKTLLQAITTHNLFEQKAYEQGFEAGAAFAVSHLNRTLHLPRRDPRGHGSRTEGGPVMSELVTDAMVEAALDATLAHGTLAFPCEDGERTCAECGYAFGWIAGSGAVEAQRYVEHRVRAALEAAAPAIAAKAWDEGYAMSERELDHAYGGHPISPDDPSDLCPECGTGNPYRAARTEQADS